MSFLEIKNINKSFGQQKVLNNVCVNVEKGELLCILGPSGCGKTTLLRIIAGLETSDSGSIHIDGMESTFLVPSKRNFGIVFQSYALFPNMSVLENILFGLKQKKVPVRMCVACREGKPKKDLIRIVKNKEGGVAVDSEM